MAETSQRKFKTMNDEDNDEGLVEIAKTIYTKVNTRLKYQNETNVPEYFAIRLIDAIEWSSPEYAFAKQIANNIVESEYELPVGATAIIRKHFDLGY